MMRPSSPPTRIAHSTNRAPRTASARSRSGRTGSALPRSAAMPASTGSMVAVRAGSLSYSTTCEIPSRSRASSSAR